LTAGIEEFTGTQAEFDAIKEVGRPTKGEYSYGKYYDEDHPDIEALPDEFGDD
jgi:hypothetical protein